MEQRFGHWLKGDEFSGKCEQLSDVWTQRKIQNTGWTNILTNKTLLKNIGEKGKLLKYIKERKPTSWDLC